MTFCKSLCAIILFISIPFCLWAQSEKEKNDTILSSEAPSLRFENLGLEDGLAQSSAIDIMQDSLGYIWIGTQIGLHRYNGYEFKQYKSEPFDSTSLSHNFIWAIEEADDGDIWVATNGGINRLNRATGTFTKYLSNPEDSTSISDNATRDVLETDNGDIWVATVGGGVNRMREGEDGVFTHYTHDPNDPNSLSSNYARFLSEGPKGNIWVSTHNGLSRINPETNEITRYLYDPSATSANDDPTYVNEQYLPPNQPDVIWVATGHGLVRLNYHENTHERFLVKDNVPSESSSINILRSITPDPSVPGVLWVNGFELGLARFDMRTEEFTVYKNNPRNPNSIAENSGLSLMTDRTGKIWLGHAGKGVSSFNPESANFTHIKHNPDNPNSLGEGMVWGIYEDNSENLWAGSGQQDALLNRINLSTGVIEKYQHDPADPKTLLGGVIFTITQTSTKQIWVSMSRGLNRLNPQTGEVDRFQHPENDDRNFLATILPSKSGDSLWIGSFGGLDIFNTQTSTFSRVPLISNDPNDVSVWDVHRDQKQNIWVGTTSGLFEVTSNGQANLAATHDPSDRKTISNKSITHIHERDQEPDILWLGTQGGGINRYNTKTGKAKHYTTEDGLPDNTIYGILEDSSGTLWMSTNQGISNFNPESETFRNYGLDDGLIALEYSQNAFERGSNGILYFGHLKGITAFNPSKLRVNETPPQVVLSELRLCNEPVVPGPESPLKEPIYEADEIILRHNQNEITFKFAALHYANPSQNQYAYQLEGFEDEWVQSSTKRTASYTNLSPGTYTFKVKAANSDEVWNNKGTSVQLTVLPPWYQTWWAYGLFTLLIAAFITGGTILIKKRVEKKERERSNYREAKLRAEEENKRRQDTERLSTIGRGITSSLSVDEIIDTIYQSVNDLMDAEVFGAGIYNEEKERLEFPATKEKGKTLPAYSHSLDNENRLSVHCFKNKKEIIIGDYERKYEKYLNKYLPAVEGDNPVSVIYLPLIQKDRVVGVLTTQSFTRNAYSEYHINLLRNLANYAAIAIDNAATYRELNAMLEELKNTQDQLVRQEKLASLGQLTAGIAHEIKNPLNFVNNFSDLSMELIEEAKEELKASNDKSSEEALDILESVALNLKKIHQHGSRADGIVKSMLQHSRGGSGKMESTDVNKLLEEYTNLSFHGMRAGKNPINVDIEIDLDENVGEIPLIAEDFSRVIVNLCSNAFDAMREKLDGGGQEAESYVPKLSVKTYQNNGNVTIEIEDNGPGIPEEVKDKILQPFFTTKKGSEGTGLGLSITNDIVKAHGGEIQIESQNNKYTCFKINLYSN